MNNEQLRTFCLALQAVTEDIKWDNDLCFSVGGKMFCVAALDLPYKVSFKVPAELFEELSSQPGIIPAPYMARAQWVLVSNPAQFSKKEWEAYIAQSYNLVKAKLTKKLRAELGIE